MKKFTFFLASILLALTFTFTNADTVSAQDALTGSIVNKRGMQRLDEALFPAGEDALVGSLSDLTEADEAVLHKYGVSLRQALVAHKANYKATFTISTTMSSEEMLNKLVAYATEETSKGNEGDYIAYGWKQVSYSLYDERNRKGSYDWTADLDFTYYETAAQEAELTRKLPAKYAALGLSSKNTYGKIKAIYDFITSSVTYDDAHVNMGIAYPAQFTAYAAFVKGTAVCQGYSRLLYRMLKENGVNARCVTSVDHMWNIIFLDGVSYCADSTWDTGHTPYQYFLRGLAFFDREHVREAPYDSASFVSENRISATDYVPGASVVTPTPTPQKNTVTMICPAFHVVSLAGRTYIEWNPVRYAKEYIIRLWYDGESKPHSYTSKGTAVYLTNVPAKRLTYYILPKDYEENGVKYVTDESTIQHFTTYGVKTMAKPSVTKKGAVSWQRCFGSGYQIRYSKNSSFTSQSTVTIRSTYQSQLKLSLKKGTYYFSIRPYYVEGGSVYYGEWSKAKKVNIK